MQVRLGSIGHSSVIGCLCQVSGFVTNESGEAAGGLTTGESQKNGQLLRKSG